ncbi:hypothetical protein IG631_11585 [Alternaria alternata]|nr:hypothetical protein IG631_11585 [Alternaria alternata]
MAGRSWLSCIHYNVTVHLYTCLRGCHRLHELATTNQLPLYETKSFDEMSRSRFRDTVVNIVFLDSSALREALRANV